MHSEKPSSFVTVGTVITNEACLPAQRSCLMDFLSLGTASLLALLLFGAALLGIKVGIETSLSWAKRELTESARWNRGF